MSYDFWWWHCGLTEKEYNDLKPDFFYAEKSAVISEHYRATYDLCNQSPLCILPKFISYNELPIEKKDSKIYKNGYIESGLSNEFSLAFDVPQFQKIFHKLPLKEDGVFRFISTGGITPVSVLYFTLLPYVAEKLPGFVGNMIVHYDDIDQTLDKVNNILNTLDEQAWDRARRFINTCTAGQPSMQYDDKIQEIFWVLPEILIEAKQNGLCFASITRPQL